jgi:hypothetical protein
LRDYIHMSIFIILLTAYFGQGRPSRDGMYVRNIELVTEFPEITMLVQIQEFITSNHVTLENFPYIFCVILSLQFSTLSL